MTTKPKISLVTRGQCFCVHIDKELCVIKLRHCGCCFEASNKALLIKHKNDLFAYDLGHLQVKIKQSEMLHKFYSMPDEHLIENNNLSAHFIV